MKVEEFSLTEQELEANDYYDVLYIKIDDKKVFSAYDGEPEDNTLGRNFNDCYNIINLLQLAYDAGVKQEGFEITSKQADEI